MRKARTFCEYEKYQNDPPGIRKGRSVGGYGGAGIRTPVQTCHPMASTCLAVGLMFRHPYARRHASGRPILLDCPQRPQAFLQVSSCFYKLPALMSCSNRACLSPCCYAARASTASSETNSSSFLADNVFASFKSWRSACGHWPDLPPVETNTPPITRGTVNIPKNTNTVNRGPVSSSVASAAT